MVTSRNKNQKKKLVVKRKGIAKKFNDKCFICNKIGHLAKDCRNKVQLGNLKKIISQAKVTKIDHPTNKILEINFSCIVSEVILINNSKQWWVDIGVIRHVYVKKMTFSTYKEVNRENLYVENSSSSKILGFRKVILKITFGKLLILNNILHVIDIRKNLVSGSLLSKNYFKMIF